jgi:quinol monooxygenase YgiN
MINAPGDQTMIHVLATVSVVSGKRDAFLAEFHKLMPLVHAEQGCLAYGPTVDVATEIAVQNLLGADRVMIVEQWESLAALKAHLAAPHMAAYRERVKPLVTSVSLQILQPA